MNEQDFDALYAEYANVVQGCVYRVLSESPDLAPDVIQDTWIKIWRNCPKMQHGQNIQGWIATVARNSVRDMLRNRKTHTWKWNSLEHLLGEAEDVGELPFVEREEADPHSYLPEQWERQQVRQVAWENMRPCDRDVIQAYVDDRPVEMAAVHKARNNYKYYKDRFQSRQERMAS